jgi:hypothetical protein
MNIKTFNDEKVTAIRYLQLLAHALQVVLPVVNAEIGGRSFRLGSLKNPTPPTYASRRAS